MDERGDDFSTFPLCAGAMTGVAIIADMACKASLIDRRTLMQTLDNAKDKANDKGRIPLAILLLLFEVLASNPSPII